MSDFVFFSSFFSLLFFFFLNEVLALTIKLSEIQNDMLSCYCVFFLALKALNEALACAFFVLCPLPHLYNWEGHECSDTQGKIQPALNTLLHAESIGSPLESMG